MRQGRFQTVSMGIKSRVDCQIRQGLLQLLYAGLGDLSAVEVEFREIRQPFQMHEPGISGTTKMGHLNSPLFVTLVAICLKSAGQAEFVRSLTLWQ
jgi:hypothetical protein